MLGSPAEPDMHEIKAENVNNEQDMIMLRNTLIAVLLIAYGSVSSGQPVSSEYSDGTGTFRASVLYQS